MVFYFNRDTLKNIMNPPFLGQFKFVNLFANRMYHLKKTKELDSAWFWGAYYLARLSCLERSFVASHLYYRLFFEVFGRGRGFFGTWLSALGAQKIVLLWFSIFSEDQDLSYKKCKDDISNWANRSGQEMAWTKINTGHLSFSRLCQFLLAIYPKFQ